MGIIADCIDTELPEIENQKEALEDYLGSKAAPQCNDELNPNTYQIVEVGACALESMADLRHAMRRVEAFLKRHWPENRDTHRTMRKALEAAHKSEALFKEVLETHHLHEGFTE